MTSPGGPVAGDPGTRAAPPRQAGLAPARPDQRYAPPHQASVPPGSKNVFIGRLVIIEGANDGLFFYNGTPARGTLIAAAVAQAGTDPSGGNTVTPVLSVGQWSAITGLPGAQSSVDAMGDLSIQGPDGQVRLKLYTGTGVQNPGSVYFSNDFGAIVQVIDPSLGYFQYQDLGSASQGPLILAQAGKNVSDPVTAAAVLAGVTLANSAGQQLTQITSANGRIRFNNAFGAAVSVIAPDIGGIFFYQDNGSATQGGAIGALVWSLVAVNDPIGGHSFGPGTTSLDPIAAGFLYYTPGNLFLGNLASMRSVQQAGHINGIGQGSGSSSRLYTGIYGPTSAFAPGNVAPHAVVHVSGTSPDGTAGAQVLIGSATGTGDPTPTSSALLEVQGAADITSGGLAVTGGTTTDTLTSSGAAAVNSGGLAVVGGTVTDTLHATSTSALDGAVTFSGTPQTFKNGANSSTVATAADGHLVFGATVELADTAAPAAPGSGTKLYSASGHAHAVAEDGNDYALGIKGVIGNPIQTISSITFVNVTGASVAVRGGRYRIKIKIWYTSTAGAGTPQFQITFPTTSAVPSFFICRFDQTGSTATVRAGNSSGAISSMTPGAGPTFPASGNSMFDGEFSALFAGNGTVQLQALTSAVADTFVVQSFALDLIPDI